MGACYKSYGGDTRNSDHCSYESSINMYSPQKSITIYSLLPACAEI